MLSRIRNFSKSIYAKFFLVIIAIPFIFWGMGPVFNTGSKNVIVKIGTDKIVIQEFGDFINKNVPLNTQLNKEVIDQLFSAFIAEKIIEKEIEHFDIKLSDKALKKIIINTNEFKKGNKFSRTEYEKYLIKNNTNAILHEANLAEQYKRKQLFDLISGGVVPPLSMVNINYNEINQKRYIELINLNNFLENEIKIENEEIVKFYESNKQKYKIINKTVKFNKINPKNLVGSNDFDSLFFEKVDEIEDLISEGKSITNISQQFNLNSPKEKIFSLSNFQERKNYGKDFPDELVDEIYQIDRSQPTILKEKDDEYLIIELIKTEEIINPPSDSIIQKDILDILEKQNKIKILSEIATKVNNKKFLKRDFDKFSKEKNSEIKNLTLDNINDDKNYDKNFISEIYKLPKFGLKVITDPNLTKNYLVYVKNVENAYIKKNDKNYDKYLNLSKVKFTSSIYNTYDLYLKNKYKIDINYRALKSIKNYTE